MLKNTSIIFLLAILLQTTVFAQVKNIVFEGAGMRGIAYSGVISELERTGKLKEVEKLGGTSAGALTAMLLSLGYNSEEITTIIHSTSFAKFNQGRYLFPGGVNRMRNYYGWYHAEKMEKWLEDLIASKTGNGDITFLELKQKGFKELYVTGTSINRQRLVVFSHETYPGMKIKDAVRVSMSIPLYFEPVFLDSCGNTVKHPKTTEGLDVMVDGGFMANFPIRLFDSTKYLDSSVANRFVVNPYTIGFRIDSKEQVKNDMSGGGLVALPVNNINQYMRAFYTLLLEHLNRQSLTDADWKRTVSISDGDVRPRIRKLSKDELTTLIKNGLDATSSYFNGHNQSADPLY